MKFLISEVTALDMICVNCMYTHIYIRACRFVYPVYVKIEDYTQHVYLDITCLRELI